MQWLKGLRGGEDRQSFIVGSDRWMAAHNNPHKSADPGKASDEQAANAIPEDESVTPCVPDVRLKPDSGRVCSELSSLTIPSDSKIYPSIYQSEDLIEEQEGGHDPHATSAKTGRVSYPEIFSGAAALEASKGGDGGGQWPDAGSLEQQLEQKLEQEQPVVASEEVLVKLPDTMVHLIDEQGSALLASGEFCLLKLVQNGDGVAIFARVGDDFRWPIAKDVTTAKLDPSHYFFTLRAADEEDETGTSVSKDKPYEPNPSVEVLSYGVTFPVKGNEAALKDLDKLLDQYSLFSVPTVVQGDAKDRERVLKEAEAQKAGKKTGKPIPPAQLPAISGKVIPAELIAKGAGKDKPSDDVTTAFWTTMAPNVQDYNSYMAKGIAAGTGHIIRGIFWCSDSTIANLQKGGTFMKSYLKPGTKDVQFSPRTMKNMNRAKKISKMSQKTANAVLSGVVTTVGVFSSSLMKSKAGKQFFKLMPGEVALVSLDAFGKLFDAVEVAGKNVLSATSVVTSDVVSHRYGGQAAELAHDGMATVGYTAGTFWTISKIRKAFNPKNKISKRSVVKSVAKSALGGNK